MVLYHLRELQSLKALLIPQLIPRPIFLLLIAFYSIIGSCLDGYNRRRYFAVLGLPHYAMRSQ